MRRAILIVLAAGALNAQAVVVHPGGASPSTGGGNSIPFASSFLSEIRYQLGIPAADLPAAPMVLSEIAFASSSSGTVSMPTLILSVGHRTSTPMACDMTTNSYDLTAQYQGPHTYTYTANTWSPFGAPVAFPYNGVDGLVVELRMLNIAGGSAFLTADAGSVQRVYNRLAGGFNATLCSHSVSTGIKLELTFLPGGAPQVLPYGTGCTGALGVPSLSSTELPFLGNANFNLELAQAAPNSMAYLFAALSSANPPTALGPCLVHLDMVSLNQLMQIGFSPFGPAPTGATGSVAFPLPVPPLPGLQGASLFFQAAITDASVPHGFSLSNGVETVIN